MIELRLIKRNNEAMYFARATGSIAMSGFFVSSNTLIEQSRATSYDPKASATATVQLLY